MGISLKTHNLLWARSGGKCALCKNELILDPTDASDDLSVVGDEAHIIARKESFTRGDYDSLTPEQRDQYSNLILLCKVHHKQVDDQPTQFTVEKLRETDADERKQSDEIIYASYIDEWEKQADLANWRNNSSWLSSVSELTLPKKWYEDQKEFLLWLIARIWPGRYPSLENSLLNYGAVLSDFLNVFDKHVEPSRNDNAFLSTRRFYKISNFDPVRYHELLEQYNAHEGLLCDLFFELTRSATGLESIFHGYRLKEGVLIIERHSVGPHLETIRARLEYRNQERTERPYPRLEDFKTIRYSRDYALAPEEPDIADYMGKEE